uniref:Uncharacterized protein n=1 Tax=Moniliophthora roreri TaxID=221103 RepID=A0A0W0FWR4_MONRR
MPPPADPRAMNGYPRPDINNTRSLISRLTTEPADNEAGLSAATHSSPEPDDTLIYPDPTPDPDVKPKIKSLNSLAPSQPGPPTATDPRNLQTPEATVPPESGVYLRSWRGGRSRGVRGRGRGRRTGEQNPRKRRRPTDSQLEKSDSSPDPDDAARRPRLCPTVAVMTMNGGTMTSPMTTLAENVEMMTKKYDRGTQLLFVGADPKKMRLLSVEEWQAMGWQPTFDPLATPQMGTIEEMLDMDDRPDTSYDYDTELYGDGES